MDESFVAQAARLCVTSTTAVYDILHAGTAHRRNEISIPLRPILSTPLQSADQSPRSDRPETGMIRGSSGRIRMREGNKHVDTAAW